MNAPLGESFVRSRCCQSNCFFNRSTYIFKSFRIRKAFFPNSILIRGRSNFHRVCTVFMWRVWFMERCWFGYDEHAVLRELNRFRSNICILQKDLHFSLERTWFFHSLSLSLTLTLPAVRTTYFHHRRSMFATAQLLHVVKGITYEPNNIANQSENKTHKFTSRFTVSV